MPHTICHVEIPTTDTRKSGEFYKNLFGWKIDYDSLGRDYALFNTGEEQLDGGLDRRDEITPGNIIIYVMVDDINTMLAAAEKLGAKRVKEKTEIPNIGWHGLFMDLDGNTIGLFTPKK